MTNEMNHLHVMLLYDKQGTAVKIQNFKMGPISNSSVIILAISFSCLSLLILIGFSYWLIYC